MAVTKWSVPPLPPVSTSNTMGRPALISFLNCCQVNWSKVWYCAEASRSGLTISTYETIELVRSLSQLHPYRLLRALHEVLIKSATESRGCSSPGGGSERSSSMGPEAASMGLE